MTETQPPADSTRAILHGLALQQRERARALSDLARLRKEASAEITRLIAFLDASDPYVMTELEDDISAELEDGGDTEPSLGSFDRMTNQEKSYRQVSHCAFLPVDGEKDDADDEPSLGSCEPSLGGYDQTRWAAGDRRDLESDPTESGIGDHDGLLEQIGWRDWMHTVMA
ncbi:hypothetical protein IVB34_40190 [Bradyrhizobium sp. 2]|uniref:hypothetical protein n=1 Tax=unclassified Bradyrhizobium TaxID=2631580 RepID=UPI001FF9DE70|nr:MULTISPECIES: hypothetical protein [unclassified Bradyrhizobium]MCK1447248.1 hypothetical protein [Bradyrhizobium sp. 48]MCK1464412.1 hypothetical protein [Bradyrhizobium sp. 2]